MVKLVSVCGVICFLEIKRCQTFIVLKGATYAVFVCFEILITYIALKVSSCVNFSVIFATRASIICIDSGTCDTLCVSLALAIRFFDISINRYTPIVYMSENAFTFCIWLINRSPGASQLAFSSARGRLGTGGTLVDELSQWFQTKGGLHKKNSS